jgi:methionyl-tRNA formyltransferase
MNLFLCGKGPASIAILQGLAATGHRVAVFTHEGCDLEDTARQTHHWNTTLSVNRTDAWPFQPVMIVVVGYLTILAPHTLEAVKGRAMNGHAALLPNHRGRSAVPWAIVDGDTVTGITYHWIDEGVDTGNILLQATCDIAPDETQATLWDKINRLLVQYFPAALQLAHVDCPGVPQQGKSQRHRAGPPHNGVIDPKWTPAYTERFIRAMTYPPLPYAMLGDVEIRSMTEYYARRTHHFLGKAEPVCTQ